MTTLSAREFNRDVSAAKRAALDGPVVITDRGRASHVLLSVERYQELVGDTATWASKLHMDEDIEFDPPRLDFEPRVPEL